MHSQKAFLYVHFSRCSCIHKCILKISRIQTCILKKIKSKFHAFKHAHAYIQTIRNSKFSCIHTYISLGQIDKSKLTFWMSDSKSGSMLKDKK